MAGVTSFRRNIPSLAANVQALEMMSIRMMVLRMRGSFSSNRGVKTNYILSGPGLQPAFGSGGRNNCKLFVLVLCNTQAGKANPREREFVSSLTGIS